MFKGGANLLMDGKGRLTIPAHYRDALVKQQVTQIVLTRQPNGSLLLYPEPVWAIKHQQIEAMPSSADGWKRILLGLAQPLDLDETGRVVVPPALREFAALSKDVTLRGFGNYAEIWDKARCDAREATDMAAEQVEAVANFNLGTV